MPECYEKRSNIFRFFSISISLLVSHVVVEVNESCDTAIF